jgi:hypothetical protein
MIGSENRNNTFQENREKYLRIFEKKKVLVMISQIFLNCLRKGYIKIE